MKLTLVTGPMFAGKTSYLMNVIRNSDSQQTIVATHISDTRFTDKQDTIINHDGCFLKHTILHLSVLSDLPHISRDEKVLLAIDEAQFFPDVVSAIRKLQSYSGLEVVLCGLNGDFQQRPFGVEPNWISQLISIATDVVYLKARCWKCGDKASFSIRKCESEEVVLVGGEDLYTASCHRCLLTKKRV